VFVIHAFVDFTDNDDLYSGIILRRILGKVETMKFGEHGGGYHQVKGFLCQALLSSITFAGHCDLKNLGR
jgi:hypothetical protein